MPEKKKKATCLADLMIDDMNEIDEMINDECFDYFDEDDTETDRE